MSLDNLPTGCLPQSLRCAVTEGIQSDDLSINEGEGINSVVAKIVTSVECLKSEKCDPCNSCADSNTIHTSTEPTNLGNLQSTGTKSSRLSQSFPLNVKTTNNQVSVDYNLAQSLSTAGYSRCDIKVSAISKGSVIESSTSEIGTFKTTADRFPLTFKVEGAGLKDGKTDDITFNKVLSSNTATTQEFLTSRQLGTGTGLEGQADVNEYLDSYVNELQGRVNALENVNYGGISGIESILGDLESRITDTQNSIESQDLTCDGVSICDIKDTMETMRAQIQVLADEIRRLDTQYSNIVTQQINQ